MEKINITELLKGCPQGMELNCTMYDNLYFDSLNADYYGTINCYTLIDGIKTSINFTKYGTFNNHAGAKCVIFPKGKTTWEGFVPPCKFKDGDVISDSLGTCIFKSEGGIKGTVDYYCGISLGLGDQGHDDYDCFKIKDHKRNPDRHYGYIVDYRLATEEEKQRLFKAIKDNGYKWNPETKALEKFVEPIEDKGNISDGYHTFNELYEYRLLYNASMFNELAKQGLYDVHKSKKHSDGTIPFDDENWFIVQAELPTGQISNHYEMKDWELFNVPEKEKANHYDGHTPQDVAKRLRDFLTPKPQYPKTYEECCDILYIETNRIIEDDNYLGYRDITPYDINLSTKLRNFRKLLICRDAYWKIAGEQMGLGKPWEPDWENTSPGNLKWCMSYSGNYIEFDQYKHKHHILAFPTEEMRVTFYENFKELIEQCKELLLL